MRIRIAAFVALSSILPAQLCYSDTVDSTKIKNFVAGQAAVAAEVNGNFAETTRAINDNFAQIQNQGSGSFGGDGSGNTLSLANDADWSGRDANGNSKSPKNFNWTNCTISAGTLTVPSGTTLRCKNGFTLAAGATIIVKNGYGSGMSSAPTIGIPTQGIVVVGTHPATGMGGTAIEETVVRSSMNSLPLGGAGTSSGGYFRIQSDGVIDIKGKIQANGSPGVFNSRRNSGGGAGGIIVLQSTNSIIFSGRIEVAGAGGAMGAVVDANGFIVNSIDSVDTIGASGGGGGGIIIVYAPIITGGGVVNTIPGRGGELSGPQLKVALAPYGDGGYGSGGKGGNAGSVIGPLKAQDGSPGYSIFIRSNPATMVH